MQCSRRWTLACSLGFSTWTEAVAKAAANTTRLRTALASLLGLGKKGGGAVLLLRSCFFGSFLISPSAGTFLLEFFLHCVFSIAVGLSVAFDVFVGFAGCCRACARRTCGWRLRSTWAPCSAAAASPASTPKVHMCFALARALSLLSLARSTSHSFSFYFSLLLDTLCPRLEFEKGGDFASLLAAAKSRSSSSSSSSESPATPATGSSLSFVSHQASLALAIACYRDLLDAKVKQVSDERIGLS